MSRTRYMGREFEPVEPKPMTHDEVNDLIRRVHEKMQLIKLKNTERLHAIRNKGKR